MGSLAQLNRNSVLVLENFTAMTRHFIPDTKRILS